MRYILQIMSRAAGKEINAKIAPACENNNVVGAHARN